LLSKLSDQIRTAAWGGNHTE